MHPLTISKGTILLIFLCCHLHISTATGTIGQKVGEKIVTSTILGGITKSAQNALIKTVTPFYKFFVEGGLGVVTRYFTLSDYWGIGQNVRKGALFTATQAGTVASYVGKGVSYVSKGVKKYAKKRMEEQMEEMNRWWKKQKLSAVASVASGIGSGISWAVSDSVIDKISDLKNNSTSSTDKTDTTTETTTEVTTTEKNHYGVSISKPLSLKDIVLGKIPDTNTTSQVIIGNRVGNQTGEADSSSTVTVWKDPFGFLFGKKVIKEDSSEDQGLYGMLFGSENESTGSENESTGSENESTGGCSTCGKEEEGKDLNEQKLNVLQGQRTIRSVAGSDDADSLVTLFQRVEQDDPQYCLPMVLCAIHADPEELRSPQEENLVTVFRPLVVQRHVPDWAGPWVRGAIHGTAAAQGKAKEADTTCEKAFPNCPFSVHHLRTLMASTLWEDSHKTEFGNDIHL